MLILTSSLKQKAYKGFISDLVKSICEAYALITENWIQFLGRKLGHVFSTNSKSQTFAFSHVFRWRAGRATVLSSQIIFLNRMPLLNRKSRCAQRPMIVGQTFEILLSEMHQNVQILLLEK